MTAVETTRARLAALPARRRCDRRCPGWAICEVAGICVIQRCDDCARARGDAAEIGDSDVAALPEAQAALARELARGEAIAAVYAQLEDLEGDDRVAVLAYVLRDELTEATTATRRTVIRTIGACP